MSFKDVLGHPRPIRMLSRAVTNDKVAHSYLFLGKDGIGKRFAALQFAKTLNCLEGGTENADACDQCVSCKKMNNSLHPDLLILEPTNQTLKVDQVKRMQRDLVYRPYEGKKRVCIVTSADRMAPNMSNILLKTLEEPPLHTVIVLLASNIRLVLPTILSRCQVIRFHPLPVPIVSKWLMEQKGVIKAEAHLLASLSEGSPGKALEIREEIREIPREELLKDLVGLRSLSLQKVEYWSESLPSQREALLLILEVIKTLLRDLVMVKTVKDRSILLHSDLGKAMEAIAGNWGLSDLLNRMEAVHQATLAVRRNANTALSLEAMMLSWGEG